MLRVYVVALARHGHRPTLVVELRKAYLTKLIVELAFAQLLARLGALACGVAGLYHEVLYNTVKQHTVVEVGLDEAYEVVAVKRSEVRQGNSDVALRRLHQHRVRLSPVGSAARLAEMAMVSTAKRMSMCFMLVRLRVCRDSLPIPACRAAGAWP